MSALSTSPRTAPLSNATPAARPAVSPEPKPILVDKPADERKPKPSPKSDSLPKRKAEKAKSDTRYALQTLAEIGKANEAGDIGETRRLVAEATSTLKGVVSLLSHK